MVRTMRRQIVWESFPGPGPSADELLVAGDRTETRAEALSAPEGAEAIEARLREIVNAVQFQERSRVELERAKGRIAELEERAAETRARRTTTPPVTASRPEAALSRAPQPSTPRPTTPWTRLPSRAGNF